MKFPWKLVDPTKNIGYFKLFLPRTSLIEILFFFDRSYIAKQVMIEKRKRLVGIETVRLVTVGQKQQRISLCHTGWLFFSQPANIIDIYTLHILYNYIYCNWYRCEDLCHTGCLFFSQPTNTIDIWCLYCMIYVVPDIDISIIQLYLVCCIKYELKVLDV